MYDRLLSGLKSSNEDNQTRDNQARYIGKKQGIYSDLNVNINKYY
jgi:hypothetical protein